MHPWAGRREVVEGDDTPPHIHAETALPCGGFRPPKWCFRLHKVSVFECTLEGEKGGSRGGRGNPLPPAADTLRRCAQGGCKGGAKHVLEDKRGGRGSGTQKLMHQKLPKSTFLFVNFIFPTEKSGSRGGGG